MSGLQDWRLLGAIIHLKKRSDSDEWARTETRAMVKPIETFNEKVFDGYDIVVAPMRNLVHCLMNSHTPFIANSRALQSSKKCLLGGGQIIEKSIGALHEWKREVVRVWNETGTSVALTTLS